MKKNYTISLDEEKVDEIKVWLDKHNLTFSGYLNSLIEEQLSAMVLYGDVGSKVTVLGVMKIFKKMVGNLNESKKKA
jgi:hypothetical protein